MARLLRSFAALLLVAPSLPAQTFDLTGTWKSNTAIETYRVRQIENRLYWVVDGTPQRGYVNIFFGLISGNTVTGYWVDMPGSPRLQSRPPTLVLRIESNDRFVKVSESGFVYNGSVWTRVSGTGTVTPPPAPPPPAPTPAPPPPAPPPPAPPPPPPPPAPSGAGYKNGGTLKQDQRTVVDSLASGAWKIGDKIRYTCLPMQMPPIGPVWGTNQYTSDSFTCYAAVHAGKIPPSGGIVIATIGGHLDRFVGTPQNGVNSADFGRWDYHLTFESPSGSGQTQVNYDASSRPSASEVEDGGTLTWSARGLPTIKKIGSRVKLTCPSGGRDAGWTYGTDIYTMDSMVCTAAVHAGVIGYGGGTFILTIVAGPSSYRGSTRNGITTADYTAYPLAMVFSRVP